MSPLACSGRLYLVIALVALTALGCSQNLENNEQYQAQVSRLERMDEDLKNAQKTISRMETEFQQAAKEIVALKAAVGSGRVAGAPGGAPSDAAVKALEQRLAQLEGQARKSTTSPTATTPVASRPQAAAPAEEIIDPEANAPASSGTGKTVTPKLRGSAAPAAKPVRGQMTVVAKPAGTKAAGTPKKKASRTATSAAKSESASSGSGGGTYYTVGSDDTIASIATKHNLSANSVLAANRLPSNVRLYAGQRLFIPRKGGIYN